MKKILFSLFIFVSLIAVAATTGCSVITSTTDATGTDPGRVTTPLAAVSGSATKSGTSFTINLSSIIVGGTPVEGLGASRFKVFIGGVATPDSTYTPVATTITATSASKIDMVFILDNTGSMGTEIAAVKNSIAAFSASLEASGADVKFGVVSYGDDPSEQASIECTTAAAVKTWLDALPLGYGGDGPENPFTAIMTAMNTFSWRTGAQKVFIVLTDASAHQLNDGSAEHDCAYNIASMEANLQGKATVYAVSPKFDTGSSPDGNSKTADVRWLVDGYGWFDGVDATTYGVTRPYTGTGGKWIELPASGNVDLTALGIETSVTKGYTLSFSYTLTATGVYYIHVLVDTNGDGVWDSDGLITITVSTLSSRWLPNGELSNAAERITGPKNN